MKKQGVLNHRLSEVIAQMGHGDMLVVADAGLPIPPEVERIDLAVTRGLPSILDVTQAIAGDLQVERIIVAVELLERNEGLVKVLATLFPDAQQDALTHEEFKALSRGARAVARTGEHTPYANIILVSGVTF